jgi:predicted dehydrogenase
MAYNLGAVGFGHWFERLYAGIAKTNRIHLAKVVGVSDIAGKAERLKLVGITKDSYYRMDENAPLPEEFFEGLDIVHISDPNKYHAQQTIQSLKKGKLTITEKTWGVNKEEFYSVVSYIKENKLENRAYLHLHYLHKLLTMELEGVLKRLGNEHGRITGVSETFFESTRDEDMRRSKWLFSMENGGLFMDWIHAFEILFRGTGADTVRLTGLSLYTTNNNYDSSNPTGIEASVDLTGELFAGTVKGSIRMAKGTPIEKKAVRIYLESGAYIELVYLDSDRESTTGMRGCWTLMKDGKELVTQCPRGPETSELFVEDILNMAEGKKAGFGIEYMEKIFDTQWQYQDMIKGKTLISDKGSIAGFVSRGASLSI